MVTLNPAILIAVEADTPEPIGRAMANLQRDLRKVFGTESPVVRYNRIPENVPSILVVGLNSPFEEAVNPTVDGWEAHCVSVERLDRQDQVVIQGADTRGTIYGIYTFCEELLDTPPLWFWAS